MSYPNLKIACIGLPGSGKSTVGRQLARRLSLPLLDCDRILEQRIGYSIRQFFEREGEAAFRDLESEVIDELTQGDAGVISTGGGAVLRAENRKHLHARTQVVYLHSLPEDVFRRLRHDRSRPLLQVADPLNRLNELYAMRDPLYRETAHWIIETGRPSVAALVHTILMKLNVGDGDRAV